MNWYNKKVIFIAKNNAKQKMHTAAVKINKFYRKLTAKMSEEHYLLVQDARER